MSYTLILRSQAQKDIDDYKKSGNLILLKKLSYFGTGKPERLRYRDGNVWSRRIDSKNRLVYSIVENIVTVEIISAKGHYDDK
ncbi:type II toxin-antitoxin system YoeB family toxin [Chryseobacterium sp. NEB161]|nr:type II toxin-antitoxin system YoeB family toxin [Chryseobacterium sp. NEB161]